MAYRHATVTLTGSVQNLGTALAAVFAEPVERVRQTSLRTLLLQPDHDNANPVHVGSDDQLSATDYGFRLEAASAGIAPAPFVLGEHDHGGPMKLKDFWILGTLNQALHVSFVPF